MSEAVLWRPVEQPVGVSLSGCSGNTSAALRSPLSSHFPASPSTSSAGNTGDEDEGVAFRAFVPWTVKAFFLAQCQSALPPSPSLFPSSSPSPPLSVSRPCMSPYVGCLLFVDISGFTALSERLSQQGSHGLELLTEHLNRYFTLIIDTIHQHGGDVVKFAGDALLCLFAQQWTGGGGQEDEWRSEVGLGGEDGHLSSLSASIPRAARTALTLHTHRASRCALAIHSALDFYSPIPSSTLRLHSALSSGLVYGLHVGGCRDRWEFVLEGDPLQGLAEAMHVSEKGQIVMHRSSLEWVSRWVEVQAMSACHSSAPSDSCAASATPSCYLLVGIASTPTHATSSRPANVRKPHLTIVVPQHDTFDSRRLLNRAAPIKPRSSLDDSLHVSARTLCDVAMRGYVPSAILARVASGHAAWLAEFRRVATLFILLPDSHFGTGVGVAELGLSADKEAEEQRRREELLAVIQQRVQLVMEVCYAHRGDVRQLITDDKGTVMILLFGLHADWANPLLGVQAALAIHARMSSEQLGAVAIGVTTGQVFCGTVGSAVRCEYTAVGDKVNTAARLMAAVGGRDGILVDADTVDAIGNNHPRVAFTALKPIRVRGKEQRVPVFVPTAVVPSSRRSSGGGEAAERDAAVMHSSLLAGRREQQQQLTLFLQSSPPLCNRLYLDVASRGMSKSVLLRWAAHRCSQLHSHRVFFLRADEQDQTAYFTLQSFIPALLHTLWELHPARTAARSQHRDTTNNEAAEASAEWLSDPTSLALPSQLAADTTALLLLNAICPAIHFQRTATVQIEASRPALNVRTATDTSTSPSLPSSRPSPPALTRTTTPSRSDVPAGAVLSLMAALLSHAHSLSSNPEHAGMAGVRAGTVLIVDDAHMLDSASEELLLQLSEQLPSIHFVFAGVHSHSDVVDDRRRGTAAGSAASGQSLRKRLTAIAGAPASVSRPAVTDPAIAPSSAAPAAPVPVWLAPKHVVVHHAYIVPLDRFSVSDLSLLVQAELDCQHVDPAVTAFLLERSGGIPAFALEMLRALHNGRLLQLTMEAETAIDESGRVRSHVLSSLHLQQVKEQSERLQQHSRSNSASPTTSLPSSSLPSPAVTPPSSTPAQLKRGLTERNSSTSAPSLPAPSSAQASATGTSTSHTTTMCRVCSFVSHWQESDIFSSLPASMDEMLASRFDACSPDLQLMLRMAAVFGRSIDRRCIRQLWQQYGRHEKMRGRSPQSNSSEGAAAAAADSMCRTLLAMGLLTEEADGSKSAPASYCFAESSMQDMIYHRMPFSLRCRLHLFIAAWYESMYAGAQLQPFYSRLAHHFFQVSDPALQHEAADSSTPASASPDQPSPAHYQAAITPTASIGPSPSASSHSPVTPSSAASNPSSSFSSSTTPTSSSSPASISSARYSAIRYLQLAARVAIQQHAKREAVVALRQCLALLESLPDAQSLHWKRERLAVMALYAPTYTHLVGTAQSTDTFVALLALCEDVQQMMDSQQQPLVPDIKSPCGATATDQTVLQTFYALRGFYFALLGSNMVNDAHKLAPRIETIALASNDLLLLHHSWIVLAVTKAERGQARECIDFCDRIIDTHHKQQAECPTLYTVNPLAPMCPVVWGMGIAIQVLPLFGSFSDVLRRVEAVLSLAQSRGEPVAYQETIYHVMFGKHYLEVPASAELSSFWAHVRASNYQMVSLQLECLMALQLNPREKWAEFRQSAEKVWTKLSGGAHLLLTLAVPVLQLLLSAGMWREGMAVVDRWKARNARDGLTDSYYTGCLQYQAQYKLLQVHERLTDSSCSGDSVDSAMDELIAALAELDTGIAIAQQQRMTLVEAKALLTSIYIQQLLLHIPPFPSSELPFCQLMAPPHVELEQPFQQSLRQRNEAKLAGGSIEKVRAQQTRLAELVAALEEQSDETVQSTFFHRARVVSTKLLPQL